MKLYRLDWYDELDESYWHTDSSTDFLKFAVLLSRLIYKFPRKTFWISRIKRRVKRGRINKVVKL